MTSVAVRQGASVAELLDLAEDALYRVAAGPPARQRIVDQWPPFAAALGGFLAAAIPARHDDHAVAHRLAHGSVISAGEALLDVVCPSDAPAVRRFPWPEDAAPAEGMERAGRLISAATELLPAATSTPRSGEASVDLPDGVRTAAITRSAEIALASAELLGRALTRGTSLDSEMAQRDALARRVSPVRRAAVAVLDAGLREGTPSGSLSLFRVPTIELLDVTDPLGRVQIAASAWRRAALAAAERPAVSSDELLRSTVEARQIIALNAALTDAAVVSGRLDPSSGERAMSHLQRAGASWSAVTDAWARFTTGVRPATDFHAASMDLQSAIRALTRDSSGAWLSPRVLANRVDIETAAPVARGALAGTVLVARAHRTAVSDLVERTGGLYAAARQVSLTEERVSARIQGKFVPVGARDVAALRTGYEAAATWSAVSRWHGQRTADVQVPERQGARPTVVR